MESSSVYHAFSAVCTSIFLAGCLYVMGSFLQLHQRQQRPIRYTVGLLIASAVLAITPLIYRSETHPHSLILAYTSVGVAWTLLYWTFIVPLADKPSVLEVLASYLQHSAYGVCKGNAKYQRSLQRQAAAHPPGACSPAGAEASPGSPRAERHASPVNEAASGHISPSITPGAEGPWFWVVLSVVSTLLSMCLLYDVVFWVLCGIQPQWCDAATCSVPPFGSISTAAAAAAGKGAAHVAMAEVAAYLRLCMQGQLPFMLIILGMDIGYLWIKLAVHVVATAFPNARPFARQLPYHALIRPWAAPSLREYWGVRWQQFSRFHFEHLGYPTVDKLLPTAAPPALRAMLHMVAAFGMTALTHTYMNSAAYGNYTSSYFACFGVHCLALLVESWSSFVIVPVLQKVFKARQSHSPRAPGGDSDPAAAEEHVPHSSTVVKPVTSVHRHMYDPLWVRVRGHVWVWSVLTLACPMFFEPMRAGGFYSRAAYHPFGRPLFPRLLSWLAAQEYGQLSFASDWLEGAMPAQEK